MQPKNKWFLFIILCMAMVIGNGFLYSEKFVLPSSIFMGTGASIISIPMWIFLGGYIAFNICLFFINLLNPNNKLSFTALDKANFGLSLGIVLKIVFGIKP